MHESIIFFQDSKCTVPRTGHQVLKPRTMNPNPGTGSCFSLPGGAESWGSAIQSDDKPFNPQFPPG